MEVKLKQLEEADVIERVNGRTTWVSPLVVVHGEKEPRLCVDMCRANEAIVRGRHPIPVIDKILEDLTGVTVFSKLDLKWGYHQIELGASCTKTCVDFLLKHGVRSNQNALQHIKISGCINVCARMNPSTFRLYIPINWN